MLLIHMLIFGVTVALAAVMLWLVVRAAIQVIFPSPVNVGTVFSSSSPRRRPGSGF